MAVPSLAIAKASLAASFMRPDPTAVSREQAAHFHSRVESTLQSCSPSNIQSCKLWLLGNGTSETRLGAIAKYLAALSLSYTITETTVRLGPAVIKSNIPAARYKQLAILYLLNDLLHHTKFHSDSSAIYITLTTALRPHLETLLEAVSAYDSNIFARHHRKIAGLLDTWESCAYFDRIVIGKLRNVVANPGRATITGPHRTSILGVSQGGNEPVLAPKDVPFTLPQAHGENSTPYYDLPAGTLLPHIKPNSSSSIDPRLVRPLQLNAGPAGEQLVGVVKSFLENVQSLYFGVADLDEEDAPTEYDELGQPILGDGTGDVAGEDSYYGWSKAFCAKMKQRQSGRGPTDKGGQHYERDQGRSPRKRWRTSSPESSDVQTRSRSCSSSGQDTRRFAKSRHARRRSPSDSRRHSQQRRNKSFRHSSPPRIRSGTCSPPQEYELPPREPIFSRQEERNPSLSNQPPQPPFPQGLILGPGGVPIPPPPAGYAGPWPPPPPPPPPLGHSNGLSMHGGSFPPFPNFIPPQNPHFQSSAMPFDPQHNSGFIPSGQAQQHGDLIRPYSIGHAPQSRDRGDVAHRNWRA